MGLLTLFGITDEQAMWRVRSGNDEAAFAILVQRWQTPIQRLCTRMIGDSHKAEDLCQEAFTRVFARRERYEPTARFSTYLWRIAMNLCYDELRRAKRRREETFEPPEDSVADSRHEAGVAPEAARPDRVTAREEEAQIVRRAVLSLPDIYRSVLVLRHYENLKLREIAEVLDIPEGTVNSRMAEALNHLTRALEPQFGKSIPRSPARMKPQELIAL